MGASVVVFWLSNAVISTYYVNHPIDAATNSMDRTEECLLHTDCRNV